jgi:hypothetical protein
VTFSTLIPRSLNDEVTGREPVAAVVVRVGNLRTGANTVGKSAISDDDVIDVNTIPTVALAVVNRSFIYV